MKEETIKLTLGKQKYEVSVFPDGFEIKRNKKVISTTFFPKSQKRHIHAAILEKLTILAIYDIQHELEKVL